MGWGQEVSQTLVVAYMRGGVTGREKMTKRCSLCQQEVQLPVHKFHRDAEERRSWLYYCFAVHRRTGQGAAE